MTETTGIFKQTRAPAPEREEEEEKRRRALVFWWWSSTVALLSAALITAGFYFTPGKGHAAREKIENAYFFRIDGKDLQDHWASFDFIILTGDFTWVKGSTTEVVSHDEVVPDAEVAERVLSPKIRDSLSGASDLIAVGLASQEGERVREEERAIARSQTIAAWLAKVSNPRSALWSLTLGQYNRGCKQQEDAGTSFERPLILAGVRSKAEGTNLQEALADAISGHDNLPSRECYSRFDMTKVH